MTAERELSSLHPESHRDPLLCVFTPEQQSIDQGMLGSKPNHRDREREGGKIREKKKRKARELRLHPRNIRRRKES